MPLPIPQHVLVALRLAQCTGVKRSGRYMEWTVECDGVRYTVRETDTTQPENYERTEVYEMLRAVRRSEFLQNWKCPEPPPEEVRQ